MSDPITHPHAAAREEHRAEVGGGLGILVGGAGLLLLGIASLLFVCWMMLASVKATPFDADGVRCYTKANATTCVKTAEPAR